MNRLLFALLFLLVATEVFPQASLSGHVYFLNSTYETGSKVPAVNVQIRALGSSDVYSDSDGKFTLLFDQFPPGKVVSLSLGDASNIIVDGSGTELELINKTEIKNITLPNNPLDRPLEIIVCPKGYLDQAKEKYYKIIKASSDLALAQKEKEFRELLEEKEKDYSRIEKSSIELALLQKQADSLSIYKEALNIASINKDKASSWVLEYFELLDKEKSVQEAREALSMKKAVKEGRESISQFKATINELRARASSSVEIFDYGDAIGCYEDIISLSEQMNVDNLTMSSYYSEAGKANQVGHHFEKALTYHHKSLALLEEIYAKDHPNLADSFDNLGIAYNSLGDYQKAFDYHNKSINIREKTLNPSHPDLATSYNNIALTYRATGNFQSALEYNKKAIAIREENFDLKHPDLVTSYTNIADIYLEIGDYPTALGFHTKALDIRKEILDPSHPDLATSHFRMGLTNYHLADYPSAIASYKKAVEISPKLKEQNYYNNISLAYSKNKQFPEAEAALSENEKLFPNEGKVFRNWTMFYALQGDKEKAIENLRKAIELGYNDLNWLKTDDSMDSLRGEEGFLEIINKLENNQK